MTDIYTTKSGSLDVNDPMALFTASNEALNAVGYERLKINGATSIQKIDASVQRADEELFKPYQVSKYWTLSSKLGWDSAEKRGIRDLDDFPDHDDDLASKKGCRTQGSAKYTVDLHGYGDLFGSMYLQEVKDDEGRNTWHIQEMYLNTDLENYCNHSAAKIQVDGMLDILSDRAVSSGVEQITLGDRYVLASEDSPKLTQIVSKLPGERIGIDPEYGFQLAKLVWSKE